MPIGKRVCESPPVPSVSGRSILFSQLWMMPSPGRRDTPPRLRMKSGREWWVTTSTGYTNTHSEWVMSIYSMRMSPTG
jgi:hypothetical protein